MVSEDAAEAIRAAAASADRAERVREEHGREAAAAVALVNRAVRLCLDLSSELGSVSADSPGVELSADQTTAGVSMVKQGDSTPVTAADFAIQALVSSALATWFPNDAFMGEEDASALREDADLCALTQRLCGLEETAMLAAIDRGAAEPPAGQRYWVLDPIDGTKGFMTGEGYIVGLALIDGSTRLPLVAVMGNPPLESQEQPAILAAVAGHGLRAFRAGNSGQPAMAVNYEVRSNQWAQAAYDDMPGPGRTDDDADEGQAEPEEGVAFPPWLLSRPMTEGSPLPFGPRAAPANVCCGALVKYWAVAMGSHSGFIQYAEKIKSWDHAAGVLCVIESGGSVTDVKGEPIRFTGRTAAVDGAVICSARECQPEVQDRFMRSVRDARRG